MEFEIEGEEIIGDDIKIVSGIKVKPGEILLAPLEDRLYYPKITPLDNGRTRREWRKRTGSGFKSCQGTQDYLSLGGTWRLPAPVRFRPSPDGRSWEARWDIGGGGPGNPLQIDSFGFEASGEKCPFNADRGLPESNQVKIVNPWCIKTAPGWSCVLLPYLYEPSPDWTLLPGVVNTDYYHSMNWVINVYTDKEFVLPIGTPIGQFFTFPRNNQKIIWGDGKIGRWMANVGLESPMGVPADRSGAYRKEQRESDAKACPVAESKRSFVEKAVLRANRLIGRNQ